MSQAISVIDTQCILGESPLWSADEQALYWVDIQNAMIHRHIPGSGEYRKWPVETEIGSIGLGADGRLICGTRMGFGWFDLDTGKLEIVADPEGDGRLNTKRLNDGKVDRAGRFWCGSMEDPGHGPVGSLYRLDPGGEVTRIGGGYKVPNALCWSPDDRVMYFADSFEGCIWAHDFDLATGAMENRRVFATLPDGAGHPDGATVDAEGCLWSANIFGGRVTRFDPDGKVERVVELPVPQVTCCAFGGADLDVLYVTTASLRMTREEIAATPLAGTLFAVEVGVRGLPEPRFGG